jgi:hypothetical protein
MRSVPQDNRVRSLINRLRVQAMFCLDEEGTGVSDDDSVQLDSQHAEFVLKDRSEAATGRVCWKPSEERQPPRRALRAPSRCCPSHLEATISAVFTKGGLYNLSQVLSMAREPDTFISLHPLSQPVQQTATWGTGSCVRGSHAQRRRQ